MAGSPRCLPLDVSVAGRPQPLRRRLPIGTGEPCRRRVAPRELVSRPPYMGVSCPEPNSIACDRVGLDVALRRPAKRVTASIAGQRLPLQRTRHAGEPGRSWQGFLQPAGLLDRPLRVTPDRGRHHWHGEHPREAPVRLIVTRANGTTEHTAIRQALSAGWG